MRTEAVRSTAKFGPIPTDSSLPASPPAEVLAALDTARGVLDSLGRGGFDPTSAHAAAVGALAGVVGRQAAVIAFERMFLTSGVAFLFILPLVLFLKKGAAQTGGPSPDIH